MLGGTPRIAAAQGATTISNGIEALSRRDLTAAMRFFRRAAVDPAPAVRSSAERWLAHLSWKVYGDSRAAAAHLDRALIAGADSTMLVVERARLLGFMRRYHDAARTAAQVVRDGRDDERRGLGARVLIATAIDGAFAALESGHPVRDSVDLRSVAMARDTLRGRVSRFPGRTADAIALIDAGALLGDSEAIRSGWSSYFLLSDDSTRAALGAIASSVDRRGLAKQLAETRLYEPAALLLEGDGPTSRADAAANDLRAYAIFVHDLRKAANRVYGQSLSGRGRDGDISRAINARARRLWGSLHWTGAMPQFYPAALPGELAGRFGTVMSIDHDAGFQQLRFAHAIASFVLGDDEHRTSRRFVILDGVASDGIDYWLLEEASGRVGWVSGDSIFELRTAFTELPFREWIMLTDSEAVAAAAARIARDSAADIDRAKRDSAAYLPGVEGRLFRDGARAILDSLTRRGVARDDQQSAFVLSLFRHLTHTTITLHETRHFLDAHSAASEGGGEDAEFRAKIDEVSGAARPKLALTAIIHPNIGDRTPHGRANLRIMLGLIRWMRANASTIQGFDASMPILVQLPLLSDAHLRAAFQSLQVPR